MEADSAVERQQMMGGEEKRERQRERERGWQPKVSRPLTHVRASNIHLSAATEAT